MAVSQLDAAAPATISTTLRHHAARFWPLAVAVGAAALLAMLTNAPGRYVGDNRFELYWAPFDLLKRHLAVWDSTRGLGRPRWDFWPATAAIVAVLRGIGLGPDLAERVWKAVLLTSAGTGAAAVLRLFRPRIGPEHWVVAFLYAFGPFAAVYLVPTNLFVGHAFAPWFLYAFVRGVTGKRPWRWAALFALLMFVPGNMNYPALIFAALPIVPAAVYLAFVERTITWGRIGGWVLRAGVLTLAVSAAALVTVLASSVINEENLQLTETVHEINRTSSWSESWRGLGFWGAYWGDSRGAIVPQFARFFWWPVVLATFVVPVAAIATLWRSRWRPRLLFAAVLALGLVLMVGAFPLDAPTPYGRALLWAFDNFPGILAVRSGHKAGVLVALGATTLGALAFAGAIRVARARAGTWRHPLPLAAVAAVVGVVAVCAFPFWTGRLFSPEDGARALPRYWHEAVDDLDARRGEGRVLVLPSTALGAYTWGRTGDDIIEGLLDRPAVARGLLSTWSGTGETANVVAAFDDYVNSGTYEPGVIGPVARRLGIEYVLLRNDLDWPATQRPRPGDLDALRADPDLELVSTFGAPGENVSRLDADSGDEAALPPLELYRVKPYDGVARADPRPPLVVSGDGAAWPGLAADGALRRGGPLRYSGDASTRELLSLLRSGSSVVISDSNRRRAHEIPIFDSIARSSYTLARGQELRRESADLFDTPGSQAVASFPDAERIEASSYGRPALPQAYLRPANAFDRDRDTAWRVAPVFVDERDQWLRVVFDRPQPLDRVVVESTQARPTAAVPDPMRITRLVATLSDGTEHPIELRDGRGTIELPGTRTESLELRVDGIAGTGPSPFGLTEVTVEADGRMLDLREDIQLPDDLARQAARSPALRRAVASAPVTYQLTRAEPVDDRALEPTIRRRFRTVGARSYVVRGRLDDPSQLTGTSCQDAGIEIDGAAVPVRATADGFEGCAPVELTEGWHHLRTRPSPSVRRVWLAAGTADAGPRLSEHDAATLTSLGRAGFDIHATTSGAARIVSGQSGDDAWSATIDGHDAGSSRTFDTQATWRVEDAGSHSLEASYDLQGIYRIALLITAVALGVCVLLLVRGRFR